MRYASTATVADQSNGAGREAWSKSRACDGPGIWLPLGMDVSIAEAKDRLAELVRAVEHGEEVVLTRDGKAVAQITPPPPERRKVRLDTMKDRIKLLPGWDDPVDEDRF